MSSSSKGTSGAAVATIILFEIAVIFIVGMGFIVYVLMR